MTNQKKHIVLKTENLSIGYQTKKKQTTIASNINLSVEKGKFIALLGKNGIGKSTLLRTLSKVQKPLNGSIEINQKNILSYSYQELATSLSLVLTERLPQSQLTVFELIALGRQPYTNWIDKLSKNDLKKILWAIEQTEITHLKDKLFHELSDGQLQRVLIARALAQDTEIIILDEPTAHLDIHHTFKVFSLLKKLVKSTNKTIIISTHEVNLAIQLADEFILLSEKQIYSGKSKELIDQNAFEKLFPKELISFNKTLEQFIIKKS
ncbi:MULTISPECIES: ABC transporter ATP-binding protein [unclassified Tenacibaculum]|uniref:ABC transporter ATP-binding protein n=1 Tax=unclassified Tenacibaculum TaxID=2635139 RepID=UPI001F463A77|nr:MULTISPECIES: ABC transporter ATP-binding protein [unclassified Tenacibaculum]MCF2874182.1 ABC transporter ATP-binding protein [Tenacibaculum sp. Cn5-1]MCF2934763.1 ABC transporter ATP-binding protein [Tenacibaculum sp. Cn5-34]MCG7510973.1 ABC transporter ATP-binding protein [Tenacibaculum sp. Cn5-46]